jgi:hypothetical protein
MLGARKMGRGLAQPSDTPHYDCLESNSWAAPESVRSANTTKAILAISSPPSQLRLRHTSRGAFDGTQ